MNSLRLPLLSKLRLSVSAAILALAVLLSLIVTNHVSAVASRREEISLAALGLGVLLWIGGRFKHVADDDEESPFRFLGNLRYLAVMTLLLGLLFFVITHRNEPPARPVPVQPAPPAPAPREFPSLRLQGIVVQDGASQALIDNRLFKAGDTMESGVQVIEISQGNVTLSLDGQTKVLQVY
jgi:hypothetical protein